MFSHKDIQVRPNIFGKLMVASMGIAALVYILSPTIRIAGSRCNRWSSPRPHLPCHLFVCLLENVFKIYFDKER